MRLAEARTTVFPLPVMSQATPTRGEKSSLLGVYKRVARADLLDRGCGRFETLGLKLPR